MFPPGYGIQFIHNDSPWTLTDTVSTVNTIDNTGPDGLILLAIILQSWGVYSFTGQETISQKPNINENCNKMLCLALEYVGSGVWFVASARSNDRHTSYMCFLQKHPASSLFNTEARQPTASIRGISPPCVLHSFPTPPPSPPVKHCLPSNLNLTWQTTKYNTILYP